MCYQKIINDSVAWCDVIRIFLLLKEENFYPVIGIIKPRSVGKGIPKAQRLSKDPKAENFTSNKCLPTERCKITHTLCACFDYRGKKIPCELDFPPELPWEKINQKTPSDHTELRTGIQRVRGVESLFEGDVDIMMGEHFEGACWNIGIYLKRGRSGRIKKNLRVSVWSELESDATLETVIDIGERCGLLVCRSARHLFWSEL